MNTTKPTIDERVKGMLCCAFEGGINYWVDHVDLPPKPWPDEVEYYHELPVHDVPLVIHVFEYDGKPRTLDRDACTRGLNLMRTKYPRHFAEFQRENDDAETADVFVQCAIFGEIVFG